MKIIFATENEDKMREIREILGGPDAEILSMKEAGISVDVKEDGETFEENALLKARAAALHTDEIVLLDRLEGVPKERRTARFVCAVAAVLKGGEPIVVRGTMEGYIGFEPKGENGFGYDPIFCLEAEGCSSAELSPEQKNAQSHRGKALRAMFAELEKRRR